MSITTYSDFQENYLVRNGMPSNDINLNKAPKQLKIELDEINLNKQDVLISGTNLKTINGNSILGSGDIQLVTSLTWDNITNKPNSISGYGITDAQVMLVSGTNIKTINGSSVLGSGDITISGGATLTDDSTTNSSLYPVFTSSTSGSMTSASVSSSKLYFNPSTGILNATQFNAFSDERLKENITTIENSLQKVNELRGVNFNFKDTHKLSMGLIAQEVQKIIPEVISENDDYMSVNYSAIIGLLVQSIKELTDKVNALENKLDNKEI